MVKIIAVGDIHGQLGVFARLDAVQARYPGAITVYIGDYVDGHKAGFAVLAEIRRRWLADAEHTVVLRGNHEQMMLDYLHNPADDNWLNNGGAATLREAVRQRFGHAGSTNTNRKLVRSAYSGLLALVRELPLDYRRDHLWFVHAGLDLTAPEQTDAEFKLWAREEYWYGGAVAPVFASNPLAATIVSGHTPTGYIEGRYRANLKPPKVMTLTHHPVFVLRYPDEYPRVFIDGGNHGGDDRKLGNVVVLDSESGALVETVEDQD